MKTILCACLLLTLLASCEQQGGRSEKDTFKPEPIVNLNSEEITLEVGTPRSEVIRLSGLSEDRGDQQVSYFSTLCGSVEEWKTREGKRIYIRGAFITKDNITEEPYIIAILKLPKGTVAKETVLWSGPNLSDGEDIYKRGKN